MNPESSGEELLRQYVTSPDKDIYAVKGPVGLVGAIYARYSRAPGGFRQVLLREFANQGVVDSARANALIERVLIEYGDDSVGELEGAHVSFEKVSMLAAKEIEDRRIGGSPIEQSTRYVFYDQKDKEGKWLYYRDPELDRKSYGGEYVQTMDKVFQTYAESIVPMQDALRKEKPIEEAEYDINGDGVKERLSELHDDAQRRAFHRAYNTDIKTKACDALRCILPVGTLTNVGVFGNGRYFQGLISHLSTSDLRELHDIKDGSVNALNQVIPTYIRRAQRNEYLVEIRKGMRKLGSEISEKFPSPKDSKSEPSVVLLEDDAFLLRLLQGLGENTSVLQELRDISMLSAMLFPYMDRSMEEIRNIVFDMSTEERARVIKTYIGNRQTRRDRPGRAFEDGYAYSLDLLTDFGTYKDLQRHRMGTQQRQLFTIKHGFLMPEEIRRSGMLSRAEDSIADLEALHDNMQKEDPEAAQYATAHGHLVRWSLGMNDRAMQHMLELRTTPQGHPSYRRVAQAMHKAIRKRSQWRADAMSFVNHEEVRWARAESVAAIEVKRRKLGEGGDDELPTEAVQEE